MQHQKNQGGIICVLWLHRRRREDKTKDDKQQSF